ncbi:MAG: hypothetical protein KC464_25075, partial [Myxococcales bacterium]|nr:hypothetical protein [Myxococcales bacterium]
MRRGIVVVAMVVVAAVAGGVAGCAPSRPIEVGDRVVVEASYWDPLACGTPYPRVVAIQRVPRGGVGYQVACPRHGATAVWRVRLVGPLERTLGRVSWGFRYLVWGVVAVALLG